MLIRYSPNHKLCVLEKVLIPGGLFVIVNSTHEGGYRKYLEKDEASTADPTNSGITKHVHGHFLSGDLPSGRVRPGGKRL